MMNDPELASAIATVLSALTSRRDGDRIKPRLFDMVVRELLRTLRDPALCIEAGTEYSSTNDEPIT